MIQGKLLVYGDDFEEIYNIRMCVFVDELEFPTEFVYDEEDKEAIQVLVYEQEGDSSSNKKKAVAAGRIVYRESFCEIDKIAVLKDYRNREYGDFTVRMLINRAFTAGIHEVIARVRPETVGFFKTIGFVVDDSRKENEGCDTIYMKIKDSDVKTCCMK